MKKLEFGVGRSPNNFGVFKDNETDWTFKRTLEYANEKCAEIGECLYVASTMKEQDIDTWIAEWEGLAERVEGMGDESLNGGHTESAKESYLRASNYYRTAEYGCKPTHPKFHNLWRRSVSSFLKAAEHFNFYFERVEIPYSAGTLPGYFCAPDHNIQKRPTLFSIGGNDSSQEEIFMGVAFAAMRRGYNFFTFEYPGHRGAVHMFPKAVKRIESYSEAFKNAFDFLENHKNVDERIALSGYSFGGFVSSYITTQEPRVKALIPDSPIHDIPTLVKKGFLGSLIENLPDALINSAIKKKLRSKPMLDAVLSYSVWTWGFETLADELSSDAFKNHIITDNLHKIVCPVLALVSEDEGEGLVKQARFFYDNIGSRNKTLKVLSLFKDGTNDHCQLDNISRAQQLFFDWLDKLFIQ